MKAVILAAGEGSRLRPFTNTIPKPLIKIYNKPIIEHNLENIYKYVREIEIIVKYKAELIEEYFWDNYKNIPISYKIQWDDKWTGAAIKSVESDMDVIILNGDSIFDKDDLKSILEYPGYAALVKKVDTPEKYGIFEVNQDNVIQKITEKPPLFIWDLANLWVYKLSNRIFDMVEKIELSDRWEYEITDALNEFADVFPFKAIVVQWKFIDVWYPWDILTSNVYYLDKLSESRIDWVIEDWVTIKWNVILEEWAILKQWTYIEGNVYIWKDSQIGPNTYIRWNTVIWKECKIWNAVEVKNSSIWDNTNIAHLSYIGDSILWNHVNIGWWFITANLRHDKANIKSLIKWELVETWLRKLWAIIWDNAKTWVHSSIMPWRVIKNDAMILPSSIVK